MADDLWILVTAPNMTQQSFQGRGGCPDLEKVWEGDGEIAWSFDFIPGTDLLPPPFARVEAHDDLGLVQTGRFVRGDPPDTSECAGACRLSADGYGKSLHDKVFTEDTRLGPRFPDEVAEFPVLATTAGAGVSYAVSQLAGQYISGVDVGSATFLLSDTENFIGGDALRVIGAMSPVATALATPFAYQVRNGLFTWAALDTSARYQVLTERGANVQPHYDAGRLYNRVVVLWGRNQPVTYPDTIVYDKLPTQVDLVVNAGADVSDLASAQRIAENLYGRLLALELGWTCTITIPFDTEIEQLGVGRIRPWRVPTQKVIRIPDLDAVGRWGPHVAASLSDEQMITQASWHGASNELVLQTGEARDLSGIIQQVVYSGSRITHAISNPGLSTPVRDGDKTALVGPALTTDARDTAEPAGVGFGSLAYSKKYAVASPAVMPAMPFKLIIGGVSSTGDAFPSYGTAGGNVLSTGRITDMLFEIPYGRITKWVMSSTTSGTIAVQLYRVARTTSGAYDTDANGYPVAGILLLTVNLSAERFTEHVYTDAEQPRLPLLSETLPTTNADGDLLIAFISGTVTTIADFVITINGERIDPRMPVGHTDFA